MRLNFQKLLQNFVSLRMKLIVGCLFLLAVPGLIIGLVGYNIAKSELDQSGRIQLQNDVRFVIAMMESLDKEVKLGNISLEDAQETVKQQILGIKESDGKRPINKNFDLGKNGYFFVLDETGNLLAHPSLEGTNIWNQKDPDGKFVTQNMIQAAKTGAGFTDYIWPLPKPLDSPDASDILAPKITYSQYEQNWNWYVVAGTYMSDFNSGSQKMLDILLITLGSSLLIGACLIWFMARNITRPITKMAGYAEKVATGDLQVEEIKLKNRDEIGTLAQSFNTMIHNLRQVLREVGISSEQVAASSEQLTASAEQSSQASAYIAKSIQEITESSESQVQSVSESVTVMKEMSAGVQQIASSAGVVAETATRASQLAASGNQTIQIAVQQMQSISNTVDHIARRIRQLGDHSDQIGQIVEVITGIANQTNLLALNAAIEAARAGEQGRGFAVVADEVRKLAAQSSESAQQITELITSIQEETANAVQSMDKGTEEVANGIKVVATAGQAFDEILRSVNGVANQIQEVSAATQQISSGAEQAVLSVNGIEALAKESAASMQNASSATEEQLATVDEIASAAGSLSKLAEELQDLISRFKV